MKAGPDSDRRRDGHSLRHRALAQSIAVGRVLDLHQGRQFDPARGAGLDLHRRAWVGRGLQDRAGGGDGVLRGVANAFQGVREADKNLIANARILGASNWQMTRAVVIPSALSWILASLHVSFGFALVGAIVGEFLGAREGMGLLIATAQGSFDSNGV